jgi:GDP-4-dehydro-6-deoxy-D-mannose reductase
MGSAALEDFRDSRILITGRAGFVGSALAAAAKAAGATVAGIDRTSPAAPSDDEMFVGDLRDGPFVERVLSQIRPTHVVHLAGVLPHRSIDYATSYAVNTVGTAALFEALLAARVAPVVLVNSSSAVYGRGPTPSRRLTEDDEMAPVSHYGVSKAAQELIARMYHASHGVGAIIARTFNLVGPRQPVTLVASALAQQVALAERRPGPATVAVGPLTPVRDFLDVRDAARAYLHLLKAAMPGQTYNVCRGTGNSVGECATMMRRLARVPVEFREDDARRSATDVPAQVGDPGRLHALTGWQARIALGDSLRDLLEFWRGEADRAEATDGMD